MEPKSTAERHALKAQSFPAFQHLNILGVRSNVAEMLSQIGRNSIFDEYTKHDISHIDALLRSLDWVIPSDTSPKLSEADWLMLVLSIYFHDLGLLVTKTEWSERASTKFDFYKEAVNKGVKGEEYAAKVRRLTPDEAEKFLYQEFVREHHAERVKLWITNSSSSDFGRDEKVVAEIQQTLGGLDAKFKRDLGLVCESHHLNDLDDLNKYKIAQPYGVSPSETCNLQYAAIILRTADLLHVTKDRAPSIAFRLINPSDPKSIKEWKKQIPLVSVLPVPAKDDDGNVLPDKQSNKIAFHAYFQESEGFFALTSYLAWVRTELRRSVQWVEKAARKEGSIFSFPWQSVDESNLEAEGFLKKEFEFSLDQEKILDLLTGHTLYNDVNVVIRELVQNGIDAIRLDAVEAQKKIDGVINIYWRSSENLLVIEDSGTGMTQEVIERHFLKAGSSRYRDAEFIKSFPNFSPISRFGIGVLSAFMIADEVEVFTVSKLADEKARKLTLRTLHGKYLIEEFERSSSEIPEAIRNHGTRISLRIRVGAEPISALQAAKDWVIFPPCEVFVSEDEKAPVRVGFDSPREVIEHTLAQLGLNTSIDPKTNHPRYKVEQFDEEGLSFAVALAWNEYFKEWMFLSTGSLTRQWDDNTSIFLGTGTCIEGIRIDSQTPGFEGVPLIAIANATGKHSPRTNVARSGLEQTPERKLMLGRIYDIYCGHVSSELFELYHSRNFSPTWAIGEAVYLLEPLLLPDRPEHLNIKPIDPSLLESSISKVKCFLLEMSGKREAVSLNELNELPLLWTLDSFGIRSIEALIRETPRPLSLVDISRVVEGDLINIPTEPCLSGMKEYSKLFELALRSREVDVIKVSEADRRIDLRWRLKGAAPLWRSLRSSSSKVRRFVSGRLEQEQRYQFAQAKDILVAARPTTEVSGLSTQVAVRSCGYYFLVHGTSIASELLSILDKLENGRLGTEVLVMVNLIISGLLGHRGQITNAREYIARAIASNQRSTAESREINETVMAESFIEACASTDWSVFDASAWSRGQV